MLYKYCDTKGFGILEKYSFRLKKFEEFNDPFELVFGIDIDSAPNNIKREYEENPTTIDEWKRILNNHNVEYSRDSLNDVIAKYIQLIINDFKNIPDSARKLCNKKYGMVCLSESMDIIQMWGHYTENHEGIVVGVEESEFAIDRETIVTVCYRDKPVLLPITGTLETFEQTIMKYFPEVLGRKESKWSYEKEIRLYARLIEKDIDGYYYTEKMPASSIKEIYLGLRSSEHTRSVAKSFKQKEEYRHLKIFQMVRHESAYKLLPKEI
jgi:hypothetical protein